MFILAQAKPPQGITKHHKKVIMSLLAQASASRLPQANSSQLAQTTLLSGITKHHKKLSCPYSRERALHVCRRQTLHIAKQCFTQDLSCASRWFAVQTNTSPSACWAFSPTIGADQGALNQKRSRTVGRVLQVRADRSVLEYVTGGSNAARRASHKPPSGGDTTILPPACRASARRLA